MSSVCSFFFWIKVSLSLVFALLAIVYQVNLVWNLRLQALQSHRPIIPIPDAKDLNASKCYFTSRSKARLEPPDQSFLWGFHVQWDRDTPNSMVSRLGNQPAIYNSFIKMTNDDFQRDMIIWNAQEVGKQDGILEITLMPEVIHS
jgi:hypothetical protein